jgi:hypothetical protein
MRAWKFLDDAGRSVFSKFVWDLPTAGTPGEWVEADGPVEPCMHGIHACRVGDLVWWINTQLWEVELEGDIVASDYLVAASRGRLIRRVPGWPEMGNELGDWSVECTLAAAVESLGAAGHRRLAKRLLRARDQRELARRAQSILGETTLERASRRRVAWLADNLNDLPNAVAAAHTAAMAAADAVTQDRTDDRFFSTFMTARHNQSTWLANNLRIS